MCALRHHNEFQRVERLCLRYARASQRLTFDKWAVAHARGHSVVEAGGDHRDERWGLRHLQSYIAGTVVREGVVSEVVKENKAFVVWVVLCYVGNKTMNMRSRFIRFCAWAITTRGRQLSAQR